MSMRILILVLFFPLFLFGQQCEPFMLTSIFYIMPDGDTSALYCYSVKGTNGIEIPGSLQVDSKNYILEDSTYLKLVPKIICSDSIDDLKSSLFLTFDFIGELFSGNPKFRKKYKVKHFIVFDNKSTETYLEYSYKRKGQFSMEEEPEIAGICVLKGLETLETFDFLENTSIESYEDGGLFELRIRGYPDFLILYSKGSTYFNDHPEFRYLFLGY